MGYVAQHGYPVPRVEEISADGSELVMERIDGATMLEALSRQPWTLRRHASVLAALHDRLHEIPGPPWLDPFLAGGDCLVHLHLHPLNVILSPKGPVLIDWSNAARGAGPADVALTWLVMMAAEIQAEGCRQPSVLCSDVCSSVHFSATSTWHPSGPSSRPSGCGNAKTGT